MGTLRAAASHATRLPQSYIQVRACTVARANDDLAGSTRFQSSMEAGPLSWVIVMSARVEPDAITSVIARAPQSRSKIFQNLSKTNAKRQAGPPWAVLLSLVVTGVAWTRAYGPAQLDRHIPVRRLSLSSRRSRTVPAGRGR